MVTIKSMDVRGNFKRFCDRACSGEALIISRPKNENVVLLSEEEYNDLLKMKNTINNNYLTMLDKSIEMAEKGKSISKSIEELESFE